MQNKTLQMKRALRTALLVLLLSVVGMGKGYAYDFSAVCETGQTLYYNITDATNHYVGLTHPGNSDSSPWEGFTKPTGNIVLPESVQYNGVTYIVTSISTRAFYYCSDLTGGLTIPNSVTTIGWMAFNGCSGFTGNLSLGNSVTTISRWAFSGCSGFTGSLTIPNSVATIDYNAFGSCRGFSSLTIGNSVTMIGDIAFYRCSGFTGNLIIPNSVTSIGDYAFEECGGLSGNLSIPNSVTSIGTNPFSSCSLEYIDVASDNPVYDSRNNCNAIIETNTNCLISGCMNSIIPNTVTTIGNYAFDRCGLNGSLTIPNSVTTIGDYAFDNCYLTSLTIPNSVTTIGDYAFTDCYALTLLNIPNSVTSIGANPFAKCWGLEHIEVASDNPVYDSRNNCNAIIETNTNELISGCMNSNIPNSVTSIGSIAFLCCTRLTTINIPNSVASIGDGAFQGCRGLTSMSVLAETPPSIGTYAFSQVDSAIPVTVPCGYLSVYEASDWHNYFTTIEEDCGSHDVFIDESSMNGGNVSTSVTSTELGEEVQLTITPNEGMMLASLIVSNANDPSQTVPVYSIGKNSLIYGFIMPPFDVVITASFSPATTIVENNEALALVYPNPTNGQVKIEAEDLKHITISNMLGQIIYECDASGKAFEYDFSKHKTGIYLIRIETTSGVAVKKVSVTR